MKCGRARLGFRPKNFLYSMWKVATMACDRRNFSIEHRRHRCSGTHHYFSLFSW